jgi:DivIVA domain-containing protein
MASTLQRPDPASPDAVAAASFSTSRKGFDTEEVRAYLTAVAQEMRALREENERLTRELEARQSRAAGDLDEATVMSMLGEETARVLRTAREGAAAMQARAEEGAARLLKDAQDEASRERHEVELEVLQQRQTVAEEAAAEREAASETAAKLRRDAIADAERLRSDARNDAEAEIAGAKQQAREMIAETRAVRERMLADLTRRRDAARQQLELLEGARQRIIESFLAARDAVDGAVARVGDAFSADVEPVPVPGLDTGPVFTASFDTGEVLAVVVGEVRPFEPATTLLSVEEADVEGDLPAPDEVVEDGVDAVADETAGNDAAVGDASEATDEATAVSGEQGVDDLFARIRAASTDDVAAKVHDDVEPALEAASADLDESESESESEASTDDGPHGSAAQEVVVEHEPDDTELEPEPDPWVERAAVLAPLTAAVARQLKRALADEQNEVLDRLRRVTKDISLDALVGSVDEHGRRYVAAGSGALREAAAHGAHSMEPGIADTSLADITSAAEQSAATTLHDELVLPLRERLQRGLDQAAGDSVEAASALRATYREWKTQRLDGLAADLVHAAEGQGSYGALRPGTRICWLVDPSGAPCPDADDNALAGAVAAGEAFPTGHLHPPAHAGCRCRLATTDG